MTDLAIETRHLTKRYGAMVAVNDLSLAIPRGEVFGFLGHNGAGKTTTVHMLTTLLKPTSGEASICGRSIAQDPLGVRRLIGYVPENVRLYDSMTAQENLRFFARLSGVADPDRQIGETLEFLDCSGLARKRVGTLSKGLRQRIGLAQAILHRPPVLFLDEPSSGLDPIGIKTLRDLIVRLNREFGTTIFMNTHLLSEVSRTCTTIGVLNHGNLVFRDGMDSVMSRYASEDALEALYLSVAPAAGHTGAEAR